MSASYDPTYRNRDSNSGGGSLLFMLLFAAIGIGVFLYFLRAQSRRVALLERDRAMVATEQARAAEVQARETAEALDAINEAQSNSAAELDQLRAENQALREENETLRARLAELGVESDANAEASAIIPREDG